MYDCRYWLWLSTKFEPGSVKCDALLHAFGDSPKAIYEADREQLAIHCGTNIRLLNALCDKSLDRVREILSYCEQSNVGLLTMDDENYPSPLLSIQGRPPVLYYKGTVPDFKSQLAISIVGTRKVSPYGLSVAYTIAHDLATANTIIVSGMALGTDTAAHRGALDARGVTVAFLGCGIDRVYPKENEMLMREIIKNGAVITDYPPGARPEGRHFPVRNRLISGVSHGVLIVEAAAKSGALITAEHALNQGKILYAIPGRIGELESEGTNRLLTAGAKTVTTAADILRDYMHLFKYTVTQTSTGYVGYKKAEEDLKKPYSTPTFNPYANNLGTYNSRTDRTIFSNNFTPYPKQEKKKDDGVYTFKGYEKYQRLQEQRPTVKPRIVYDDKEIEIAEGYMSMGVQEEPFETLIPQKKPDPLERMSPEELNAFINSAEEKAYAESLTNGYTTPELEAEKRRRNAPTKTTLDPLVDKESLFDPIPGFETDRSKKAEDTSNEGLSPVEIHILSELKKGKRLTADNLSETGLPLTQLISALSMLEIKQRIIQLPGGYYELSK